MKPDDYLNEAAEKLSSFSLDEITKWLLAQLRGEDVLLPGNPDYSQAYAVVVLRDRLDRLLREDLDAAVLAVLSKIKNKKLWDSPEAAQALLLLQHFQPGGAAEFIKNTASEKEFNNLSIVARHRIMQALIGMEASLPASFWRRQFAEAPEVLAGVAFDGLSLASWEAALELLKQLPDKPAAIELVTHAFPGFWDYSGAESRKKIHEWLSRNISDLPATLADEIKLFLQEEGYPILLHRDDCETNIPLEDLEECLFTLNSEQKKYIGKPVNLPVYSYVEKEAA